MNTSRLKMWINIVSRIAKRNLNKMCKKTLTFGEICLLKMLIKILKFVKNTIEGKIIWVKIWEIVCHCKLFY
jgi:hypothetical protein